MATLLPALFLLPVANRSHAQATTLTFGQNRVQYKDFPFQYYDTDRFTTYFYPGGQDIAKYVIKQAEDQTEELSKLLDYRYKRKIDIILYNSIHELNQTNVGIYERGQNNGGTTQLPNNKLLLYFNGEHADLQRQIREGLATLYIDRLMTGTNVVEFVQNAVLLSLPDWFKKGLVEYLSAGWSSKEEDRLRDGILSGRYRNLKNLPPNETVFVGRSIWHYIEEVYGPSSISNLLYLTRINHSIESGFQFVLGNNVSATLQNWYSFYGNRFKKEQNVFKTIQPGELIPFKARKELNYYQLRLSADGKQLAYASDDLGKYRVWVKPVDGKKKKRVFGAGFSTNTQRTDGSVPVLAWNPKGKELAIVYEKKSVMRLMLLDTETGKKKLSRIEKFQKVYHAAYTSDGNSLVLSAMQKGQTDVFLYKLNSTTTTQITNDFYDDLYPAWIETRDYRGVMFSSNRPNDSVPVGLRYDNQNMGSELDLFFYPFDRPEEGIVQITNTPLANETYAQNWDSTQFSFLSDQRGISNRYTGEFTRITDHYDALYYFKYLDTGESDSLLLPAGVVPDSVVETGLIQLTDTAWIPRYKTAASVGITETRLNQMYEQSVAASAGKAVSLCFQKGKPVMIAESIRKSFDASPYATEFAVYKNKRNREQLEAEKKLKQAKEKEAGYTAKDSSIIHGTYRSNDFQSEFDYGMAAYDLDTLLFSRQGSDGTSGYQFRFNKVRPYFTRFMVDKLVSQLDNTILMTRYQVFDPSNIGSFNPPMSFLFKLGITDILENHKLYGGFRFPFAGISKNSEYFITYENLKKRLDFKITYYRRVNTQSLPYAPTYNFDYSIKTNYVEAQFKYPIDVLKSFKFGAAYRNDRYVAKANDLATLNTPDFVDNWAFLRADFDFDNTREIMVNIRQGTRFNAFAEFHKQIPAKNSSVGGKFDFPVPQWNNNFFAVFGADLRHYQKIHKQIILATRLSAGASLGNSKLIYYLGATDNWFLSRKSNRVDATTPVNMNNGYAFQTLATPLRGFLYNVRNGNQYVLLNCELRIPIFAYLIKGNLRSDILRNFQLVGFFDTGTAWEGKTPFSDQNPLFVETISNSTTTVRVKKYKTPFVMGFGPGFRTTFLGYFLRFDTAWGYDTGEITSKPIYYFTFGYDF